MTRQAQQQIKHLFLMGLSLRQQQPPALPARLDRLALQDLQALKVPQVRRARLELQEKRVPLVQLDQPALLVQQETQDQLVLLALLVRLALLDQSALQEIQDLQGQLESLVPQDRLA